MKKTFSIHDVLHSEISLKDKRRFVITSCDLTTNEVRRLVLNLAWAVLPIFEEKYPEESIVRNCLETAEKFLLGEVTNEELQVYRNATRVVASDAANEHNHTGTKDSYTAQAAHAAYATYNSTDTETHAYIDDVYAVYMSSSDTYANAFIETLEKAFE